MSASLDGVRGKISRAKQHFDELKEALTTWETSPAHAGSFVVVEYKPKGKYDRTTVQATPLPPGVPFLIGDIVHNLRCALDHLVCQLAIAAGNRLACKDTQFPIFQVPSPEAQKRIERWLKPLQPEAARAIEDLQPYKRRATSPDSDELWLINRLDNIDKHRTIVVVVPKFAYRQGDAEGEPIDPVGQWKREEDGAQIFELPPAPESHSEMDVDRPPEVGVYFQGTGLPCDGQRVRPTVERLIAEVERIVDDFDSRFFG